MRIYSDKLTTTDLRDTARKIRGLFIDHIEIIRSPRVRKCGYVVITSGESNHWKNSGTYGAATVKAATWDQHGEWFALLYAIDPDARIVNYESARDFHDRTQGKYRDEPEPSTLATHGVYIQGA